MTSQRRSERTVKRDGQDQQHHNEVILVGKVAATPFEQTMPSGDVLVSGRVVIRRNEQRSRPRAPTVDALDCSAWSVKAQRSMRWWKPGDLVEVRGALRRRFLK